ncbi:twp-component sensor histidine kinase [Sporocytophaga myxococcoides]|uniref:histidine kinase n=1 Tax=Sporocytophaga myxococcoides TaxID=153721 RepID=A0A098LJ37_9BACT|nr:HAMP domain-containing sensor histidine kinase [Sporocytophaga myxococcoides]GAL87001.1 twp-component sensor histidine kinase [Sporocytophaga myxococcoides]
MKLLQRTTLYYLLYSLFIFGIGTILFYVFIKIILWDGIDEAIYQEKVQLVANLNYEKIGEGLQPSTEVSIMPALEAEVEKDKYNTVPIYDSLTKEYTDFRQLTSYHKNGEDWYKVTIRQPLAEAESLLNSILPVEIGLFLILLGGVLLMNRFILAKIWQPFYVLLDKLKKYNLETTKIIPYESTDIIEFQELNINVEKMTERIYKDFLTQKEFNENSSHEMQTPLAIIKNKLELIIQSKNLTEQEMLHIQSIFNAVKRLTLLNKGLLLLSKIENRQFTQKENVNLGELLQSIFNLLEEQIIDKNITTEIEIKSTGPIKTNRILIEGLLNNLVSNSIKHNIQNGKITAELTENHFIITNTGIPLSFPADEMFERFRKDSSVENSVGLGLSIVKKICDFLDYKIVYIHKDGLHTLVVNF